MLCSSDVHGGGRGARPGEMKARAGVAVRQAGDALAAAVQGRRQRHDRAAMEGLKLGEGDGLARRGNGLGGYGIAPIDYGSRRGYVRRYE